MYIYIYIYFIYIYISFEKGKQEKFAAWNQSIVVWCTKHSHDKNVFNEWK